VSLEPLKTASGVFFLSRFNAENEMQIKVLREGEQQKLVMQISI